MKIPFRQKVICEIENVEGFVPPYCQSSAPNFDCDKCSQMYIYLCAHGGVYMLIGMNLEKSQVLQVWRLHSGRRMHGSHILMKYSS